MNVKKEVIASSRMDLETVMRNASVIRSLFWLSPHNDMRELFLNFTEFHDALAATYNWNHAFIGKDYQCGAPFTVSHVLSCKSMGSTFIRHNAVVNAFAQLLGSTCHNVIKRLRYVQ
ncbi:hypothetical protein GJ496_011442 [Pomphorhynchus laevis]|nr:hypothetical protein GJ496_011442 [Pomphorhynchus laevis]